MWTVDDTGCIWLVALEEEDGVQGVGFPLLFPRVCSLTQDLGFDFVHVEDGLFVQ